MAERGDVPSSPTDPGVPKHPRIRQASLVLAAVLALAVAVLSGLSLTTIRHLETAFHRVSSLPTGPTCTGSSCLASVNPFCTKTCSFLVLGSDTRAGLSKAQQAQFGTQTKGKGQRADTIIVIRIDQIHHRTIVLSIPRDLRVPIPGFGVDKINTAFGHGPNVLVRTVQKLTGMKINHYVEVNFVGFQALVNVLGGVPICVPKPMIDPLAGLHLPHAGCYDVKGAQALAFVRARHIQGDIIPDFSRIARQQQFLRALMNKILSVGAITHISDFVDSAKQNLRVDDHLNLDDLQDLAHTLGSNAQEGVLFRMLPAVPVTINGEDFVQLQQPQASDLLQRIRTGARLGNLGIEGAGTPIAPANITVHVYDASSGGKANAVAAFLKEAGFVVDERTSPGGNLKPDTIYAGSGAANQPQVVRSYLINMAVVRGSSVTRGGQVVIVVGPNYRQQDIPNL